MKDDIRRVIRHRDIEIIFRKAAPSVFKTGLELGCGDGYQSGFLKNYIKDLTISDKLTEPPVIPEGVKYICLDAECTDNHFDPGSLDIIFSSNVLEHVKDISAALRGMKNILKDSGIMIHTMPNTLWKCMQYIFFVPAKLRVLLKRAAKKPRGNGYCEKPFSRRRIWDKLFPAAHGGIESSLREFKVFSQRHWEGVFKTAGLEVISVIPLGFHTHYRFG